MRLRFSLRWLLVGVTVAAIACGIFVFPTFLALQLVRSVNNGDYRQLDSLKLMDANWQYKKYSYKDLRIEAVLHPRTWRDAFQFRRRVSINIWRPQNVTDVPISSSSYVFVRITGPKLGGETWE
jgi:hypothetical protein